MNNKKDFDGKWAVGLLEILTEFSDDSLATVLNEKIVVFLNEEHTDLRVWNFCVYLLDMIVNSGGATSAIMIAINFEPYYNPPEGAITRKTGAFIQPLGDKPNLSEFLKQTD